MSTAAPKSGSGATERGLVEHVRDLIHDRIIASRHMDIVQRSMARPVPDVRPKRDFEVARVDDPDSPVAGRLADAGRPGAAGNLAVGDVAFVALDGEEIAGWVWYTRRSHVDPYGGIRMNLLPDEGYTYDLYAVPRYRPDGVAALVMQAMLRHVAEDHDIATVYSYVNEENRESQFLLRMVFGFTSCQKATSVRLLDRFGLQVPLRTRPRGGPSSRRRAPRAEEAGGS